MRRPPVPTADPRPALERRLAELTARSERIESRRRGAPGGADGEVLDSLADDVRVEEGAIRRALARMDAGTYGTCEHCNDTIAADRLLALPTASTCVRCAT